MSRRGTQVLGSARVPRALGRRSWLERDRDTAAGRAPQGCVRAAAPKARSQRPCRVLGYAREAQQRGVFHPHVVLGYRTAADRAALETFRSALRRKRGSYGFGTGRKSFDGGMPDRFSARDAARYVSKYLPRWRQDVVRAVARTNQPCHSSRPADRTTQASLEARLRLPSAHEIDRGYDGLSPVSTLDLARMGRRGQARGHVGRLHAAPRLWRDSAADVSSRGTGRLCLVS
jgi:hypothetical protein